MHIIIWSKVKDPTIGVLDHPKTYFVIFASGEIQKIRAIFIQKNSKKGNLYTVGPQITVPLGEKFKDIVKKSVRCFENFLVCLVLIKVLYNDNYVVSMVRYIEVWL